MKKIGMVVAMQSEVESFLSAKNLEIKRFSSGGFKIITFTLGDSEVYCVQSGVGEIFAASATQMLISSYGVDVIFNFGVCGSLVDGVDVGNVDQWIKAKAFPHRPKYREGFCYVSDISNK